MRTVLILIAMAAICALGFFVMRRIDIFLDKNRKNIDEHHFW